MAEYKDIEPLKKQIADIKKAMNSQNSDYLTGYLCALSVTEGIIATLPTADVVPKSEVERLEYTLQGVMWSVDKWLDEAEYNPDPVKRALTMREKTLQIVENLRAEVAREIFEDAHNMLSKMLRVANDSLVKAVITNNKEAQRVSADAKEILICVITCFAELQNKYTEGASE